MTLVNKRLDIINVQSTVAGNGKLTDVTGVTEHFNVFFLLDKKGLMFETLPKI